MIAIIDYDAGNLKSVQKALDFLHQECVITRDFHEIRQADKVILPGVGSFGEAMVQLKKYELDKVIQEVAEELSLIHISKWLEGVAYSLAVKPDNELEARADEIIDIIEKAQQPNGYLDTFFIVKEPEHRWQNLQECHELYCAGHMMEAGVAYYQTTGKDKLLHVVERLADHIISMFGEDKEPGIPGHQEVEIGLMKLYRATGKEKYKDMARYFLEERGKNPNYFYEEKKKRGWQHWGQYSLEPLDQRYTQTHATIYEQKEAVGHSVRAVYMYTAMADLAGEDKDQRLYRCV